MFLHLGLSTYYIPSMFDAVMIANMVELHDMFMNQVMADKPARAAL